MEKLADLIVKLKDLGESEKAHQSITTLESFKESDQSPAKREAMEVAKDLIEADRTHNEIREILRTALKSTSTSEYGPYIDDISDDWLIYEEEKTNKYYKANYTIDANNKASFTNTVEVKRKTIYEPVKESKQTELEFTESTPFQGEIMPLLETGIRKDGSIPIKIIQPGWGASGYYPADVLKRDAGIYKEGTKMYLDHPTISEEKERPERSVKDLAGVLISNGVFKEDGHDGPGVYASAKVFSDYNKLINDKGPHIGISHVSFGQAKTGEAEGKKGRIIESLKFASSVDFVTTAGAGGKIVELFESLRNIKQTNMSDIKKEDYDALKESNDSLTKKLGDLEKENQRMKEAQLVGRANNFVAGKLKESKLPEVAKSRLQKQLASNPVVKDGELDEAKYTEVIEAAVTEEIEYFSKVSESGKITGMGDSVDTDDLEKVNESIEDNINAILGKEKIKE